jgi:hypothetical protein
MKCNLKSTSIICLSSNCTLLWAIIKSLRIWGENIREIEGGKVKKNELSI